MKDTLKAGLEYELRFRVPDNKTVPALYPHIDWPNEQTVGISINVNHTAATPPGLDVCARVKLIEVDGKRLVFEIELDDGVDAISKGTHERFIINAEKFNQKIAQKAEANTS
jgi:fluoroacetyl-CoA thioesterase